MSVAPIPNRYRHRQCNAKPPPIAISRAVAKRLPIVDGHERAEHFGPDDAVPCCLLDIDEDEAKKLLLSYDPRGYLGGVDEAALKNSPTK